MPKELARKGPNLRKLKFHPELNPLMDSHEITVKKKHVRTGLKEGLVNTATGEIEAASVIHTIEEVDDAHFVKIFASGIAAVYDLTRTASRVFQIILNAYQCEPMSGGFADSVYLAWYDGTLNGTTLDMSEDTYQRGLKELLAKGFLAPRQPNLFWVNPNLFFKGDRALFLREYRRKKRTQTDQEKLESRGQQRLIE